MASVNPIAGKSIEFLLNNNVRLNGLTTLIKNFDLQKNTTIKNLLIDKNNKGKLTQIVQSNINSEKSKNLHSLFPNLKNILKGTNIDILA